MVITITIGYCYCNRLTILYLLQYNRLTIYIPFQQYGIIMLMITQQTLKRDKLKRNLFLPSSSFFFKAAALQNNNDQIKWQWSANAERIIWRRRTKCRSHLKSFSRKKTSENECMWPGHTSFFIGDVAFWSSSLSLHCRAATTEAWWRWWPFII